MSLTNVARALTASIDQLGRLGLPRPEPRLYNDDDDFPDYGDEDCGGYGDF